VPEEAAGGTAVLAQAQTRDAGERRHTHRPPAGPVLSLPKRGLVQTAAAICAYGLESLAVSSGNG
jgi:hypothetical protein